ncbi:tetratricopeptide repeat protein [Prosthecobacter algae]|uniref:Tetratricopeptide repeat protein n=1 Tax=Prosthecobacter algae TaxID=1144682 RepID=A0ABP9PRV1_9BACT
MTAGINIEAALELHRSGRVQEACTIYAILLQAEPGSAVALQGLATAHAQRGDFVVAVELFDRALKLKPDYAEAHANRGNVLRCLARFEEALECYHRATELKPVFAEAYNSRGVVLRDLKRLEEALANHERAIEIKPDYANAWMNRGIVLREMGRYQEALSSYEQVIEMRPEDAQTFNYQGMVLYRLERYEEALASYRQAIRLRPDYAEAHYHHSLALRETLRVTEAVESCDRAIQVRPSYAEAWWNRAELLILAGDYPRGWRTFSWRWRSAEYGKVLRQFVQPLWDGTEDIAGKTLLVTLDGGFGDTLQFCRYVSLVVQRGADVILEVQAGLLTLMQGSFDNVCIITNGQRLPAFDCSCPLMNLPGAFALAMKDIPARLPYLQAPRKQVETWVRRLGTRTRPRIGLVWSGSTEHSNDRQRSMTLATMAALLDCDAEFHCLQKQVRDVDRQAIVDLPIHTWEEELSNFSETAGLIMALDLVISVDTSVAHLAGALGRPVWVMLPHVPDMRWLLERDDSPWYPEIMRLFRQPSRGAWPRVIARVSEELNRFIQSQSPPGAEISSPPIPPAMAANF